MIRQVGWQVGWWEITAAALILAVLAAWFVLTSPRARANRAKLRARRRHDRALRSIQ